MAGPTPYRSAGRAPVSTAAPIPRTTIFGLSFGAGAFAIAGVAWLANNWIYYTSGLIPARGATVLPFYVTIVDAAIIGTTLLCARSPVPGTRARLAAIVACGLATIAFAAELVSPPYSVWVIAHIAEWAALAWLVLECARVFWTSAVPVLAGAAIAIVKATQSDAGYGGAIFAAPMRNLSGAWFIAFALFSVAFLLSARAARRSVPVGQVALDPAWRSRALPIDEGGQFEHWCAVSRALHASFFAVATFTARALFEPGAAIVPAGAIAYADVVAATALALAVMRVLRATRRRRELHPTGLGAAGALALSFGCAFSLFSSEHLCLVCGGEMLAVAFVVIDLVVRLPAIALEEDRAPIRSLTVSAGVLVAIPAVFMLLGGPTSHIFFAVLLLGSCVLLALALRTASVLDREVAIASAIARNSEALP